MVQAITDSLVPFTWFLVPVFIAALALGLLILFAAQTSRTTKRFLFWLDTRGIRRPEGKLRALLVRRVRERPARRPATSAAAPEAAGEGAPRAFLKSRARQRLQEKTGVEAKRSVGARLAELSAKPPEAPLAPTLSEETLRRLEARSQAVLGKPASGGADPARPASGSPDGARALHVSRQMTESMLRSLEEQVRQGLLAPQTFEELKARLASKQGAGVPRG